MKRILGIAIVLGFVGALTVVAQEVKSEKIEVVDLGKDVKLEMVLILAGEFKMGLPTTEVGYEDKTQHKVTLTKPFYMGKYEVTQGQWEAVMGKNPSREKGRMFPVTDISWNDCQDFTKKLNAKTNGGYRLPTEAEWEYACRAGTTTAYSVGNSLPIPDANINGDYLKKVGSYKPNAFGLYDMHGNVCEWCEDYYEAYSQGYVTGSKGPAKGEDRVLRGGSYLFNVSGARSSFRHHGTSTVRVLDSGFRLARTK